MIVDAHMHIWNRLHGKIANKIPLTAIGNGVIQLGDRKILGMPATHTDSTAPAEAAVAEFDAAGVDVGVVVQENMDGEQNDYCLAVMQKFPGRFFCHGLPDYFQPATFTAQCEQLFAAGFRGIKVPGGHLAACNVAIDDPAFLPVWERMASAGYVMAVDLTEGETQVPEMESVLKKFPKLPVAIGHFGMPNRRGWPGQLNLCKHENVYIETGGIIWLYRAEGYPFPGAIDAIQQAASEVGWEKLMWGSDWPRTMVDFTYRQSLSFIQNDRSIAAQQKDRLLGLNAARLYQLPEPVETRTAAVLITEI